MGTERAIGVGIGVGVGTGGEVGVSVGVRDVVGVGDRGESLVLLHGYDGGPPGFGEMTTCLWCGAESRDDVFFLSRREHTPWQKSKGTAREGYLPRNGRCRSLDAKISRDRHRLWHVYRCEIYARLEMRNSPRDNERAFLKR